MVRSIERSTESRTAVEHDFHARAFGDSPECCKGSEILEAQFR
jgi:hypothetical protein